MTRLDDEAEMAGAEFRDSDSVERMAVNGQSALTDGPCSLSEHSRTIDGHSGGEGSGGRLTSVPHALKCGSARTANQAARATRLSVTPTRSYFKSRQDNAAMCTSTQPGFDSDTGLTKKRKKKK